MAIDRQRRKFLTLLGSATTAWPLAARAQQSERLRRIAILMGFPEGDREGQAFVAAFRDGLRQLGWIEGRNIRIDRRWASASDLALIPRFATELVALEPDLILSQSTPTTAALLKQTRSIPIIFAFVSDPLGSGFVASFREPGGNATGFIVMEPTIVQLFRGAKVSDIPVEQPTRFELVINLQTAKAIGHEIPANLVLRADRLIE
jgi:putative ABC transport system substrate-binding protein